MEIKKEWLDHLNKHIVYPTTKRQIIETCNIMADILAQDKEYFERTLPDWNYRNAYEVIRGLQISEHLGHVIYPTNKKTLVKACKKMSDVTKYDKEWFEHNLPERTYNNKDDILGTLKGIMHIRQHVVYPASKTVIFETCNKMLEVPEAEREWLHGYLPDRNYRDADEVIKAFKL